MSLAPSLRPVKACSLCSCPYSSVKSCSIITHFFQTFSQNICSFLLVDEDDNWRIDSSIKNLNELVSLVILLAHVDDLFSTLNRFANCTNVNNNWSPEIVFG